MPLCNVMTQPLGETERSLKATVLQTMIGQLVTDRWPQRLRLNQVRCPANSLEQGFAQHGLQRLRLNQFALHANSLAVLGSVASQYPKDAVSFGKLHGFLQTRILDLMMVQF